MYSYDSRLYPLPITGNILESQICILLRIDKGFQAEWCIQGHVVTIMIIIMVQYTIYMGR